jgi:hypothetical protein
MIRENGKSSRMAELPEKMQRIFLSLSVTMFSSGMKPGQHHLIYDNVQNTFKKQISKGVNTKIFTQGTLHLLPG